MRTTMRRVFWAVLLALTCVTARAGDNAWEARVFTGANGKTLPYRLLKPLNYDAKTVYPFVILLHGAGERGTDNAAQLKNGVRELLTAGDAREKYPCFAIAPQCPENCKWVEVDWSANSHKMPEQPSVPMGLLLELIPALQKEFSLDPTRFYVSGLSMGGYGTWDLLARKPEWFAAGAPICGGADENTAPAIAKIPVWVFHGGNDGVVKTIRSRNMVEALKKAGATPQYSEYPGVGHDSWNKAFKEPKLLEWMFAQTRAAAKATP
jgi:predicted peptidase